MQTEIEAKFLNIEGETFRKKLKENNATLIYSERPMKRKNFDYPERTLEKNGGWVRVRDEGDIITLSYKRLVDRTIEGTKEISVEVNDFEKICNIFYAIGLVCKSYQETKREKWMLDGVEITIDTWPWIPTFVELEGESEERINTVASKLDLNRVEAVFGSVEVAYQDIYNVTEEEVDSWETITFIPVPEWLEIRRK